MRDDQRQSFFAQWRERLHAIAPTIKAEAARAGMLGVAIASVGMLVNDPTLYPQLVTGLLGSFIADRALRWHEAESSTERQHSLIEADLQTYGDHPEFQQLFQYLNLAEVAYQTLGNRLETLGEQIDELAGLLKDMQVAGFATPLQIQIISTGGEQFTLSGIYAGHDSIGRDLINVMIQQSQTFKRNALHQLRAIPETFTGRSAEIANVLAHIKDTTAQGTTVTVTSSIIGMGGVGKTELANTIAHMLSKDYPDAQLLLELGANSANPQSVSQVLTSLLQQFEPEVRLPEVESELRALYLNALNGKRAVVIIDDAVDASQVKVLLPPPGCVALVTSRQALSIGVRLPLKRLSRKEAIALLQAYRAGLSDADANAIASLCIDLPVALTVAGGLLAAYDSLSSEAYLTKLRTARLEMLADENASVRTVFATSFEALTPQLRIAWVALAVMPTDFDRAAGIAVAQLDANAVPSPLDELVKRSLIEYDAITERFRWHDLLQEFASEQTTPYETMAARIRHVAWIITVAEQANALFLKGGANVAAAARLFDRERGHIDATLAFLSECNPTTNLAALMVQLLEAIINVSDFRFKPDEQIRWMNAMFAAAQTLGDRKAECTSLAHIGLGYARLGETNKAIEFYAQALQITRDSQDHQGTGHLLISLGNAYNDLGKTDRAISYYEEALTHIREIGDVHEEGSALGGLGRAYFHLGAIQKALDCYSLSLAIARQINDPRGEGSAFNNLGLAYSALGDSRQAIAYYEQALAIYKTLGDRRKEGTVLGNLGGAYYTAHEFQKAMEHYEQSLVIAIEISNRRLEAYLRNGIGLAWFGFGDYVKAASFFEKAIEIHRGLGNRRGEAESSWNLGELLVREGKIQRAIGLMQMCADYEHEIGSVDAEKHAKRIAQVSTESRKF